MWVRQCKKGNLLIAWCCNIMSNSVFWPNCADMIHVMYMWTEHGQVSLENTFMETFIFTRPWICGKLIWQKFWNLYYPFINYMYNVPHWLPWCMYLFYVDFILYLYKFTVCTETETQSLKYMEFQAVPFCTIKSTDIPKWLPHISFHADQVPVLQFIKEMK